MAAGLPTGMDTTPDTVSIPGIHRRRRNSAEISIGSVCTARHFQVRLVTLSGLILLCVRSLPRGLDISDGPPVPRSSSSRSGSIAGTITHANSHAAEGALLPFRCASRRPSRSSAHRCPAKLGAKCLQAWRAHRAVYRPSRFRLAISMPAVARAIRPSRLSAS